MAAKIAHFASWSVVFNLYLLHTASVDSQQACVSAFSCSGQEVCLKPQNICGVCTKHEDCGDLDKLICKDSKCVYCKGSGTPCQSSDTKNQTTGFQKCGSTLSCSGQEVCLKPQNICGLCTKHEDCGSLDKLICKASKCMYCLGSASQCENTRECCACPACSCQQGLCLSANVCTSDGECKEGEVCFEKFGHKGVNVCQRSCNGGGLTCSMHEYCKNGRCLNCVEDGNSCGDGDKCCYATSECNNGVCKFKPPTYTDNCVSSGRTCKSSSECCGRFCRPGVGLCS